MEQKDKQDILSSKESLMSHIAMIYDLGLSEEDGGNDNIENYCGELFDEFINNQIKDKTLRITADFENYKKRVQSQQKALSEQIKFETLIKFIEILDDWSLFSETINKSKNSPIEEGFGLLDKKMLSFLKDNNIEEIPTDIPFNSDLHECVTVMDQKKRKGSIIKVISKGYKLNDRVIKHSKVIVQS